MKRNLLLYLLLGLGLSACNKDDSAKPNTELTQENTVLIKGEEYTVDFVIKTISQISKIPVADLYYDETSHAVKITYSTLEFQLDLFADDLKRIKNAEKI